MTGPEYTGYPINGPSPIVCDNGGEHYLHIVARWEKPMYTPREGSSPIIAVESQIVGLSIASLASRVKPMVSTNSYVRIPFDDKGVPDRSKVIILPGATVTEKDVELLRPATDRLGIWWSLEKEGDLTVARVVPEDVVHDEPHGQGNLIFPELHSSTVVLAGLRLLATRSVMRYTAHLN